MTGNLLKAFKLSYSSYFYHSAEAHNDILVLDREQSLIFLCKVTARET